MAATLLPASSEGQAQVASVTRAVELEQTGKAREAIAVWRELLASGQTAQAILGLERIFSQLGQDDSLLVAIEPVLAAKPGDRAARGAQMRTLRSLGRDTEVRGAFDAWVRAAPGDAAPYKEFAGQLMADLRNAVADSILQQGVVALGSPHALLVELAQLSGALGQWGRAAAFWRDVMLREPYADQGARYSLANAPAAQRDSVRAELARADRDRGSAAKATQASATARKALGMLELGWGNPREAWNVLSTLTAADSAYATWEEFAEETERTQAWLPARDALLAMHGVRASLSTQLRAAGASNSGGDPAAAIAILASARLRASPEMIRTRILVEEVRALTNLARPADAEALVARDGAAADAVSRRAFARQVAWGWVRTGQVEKAQAALAGASADDSEEVVGWIALFAGDFVKARAGLRRPADATSDVVTAMALLGRTRADSGAAAGAAFLALARGDTAGAAQRFERAAADLPDVASLLLAHAARLHVARRNDGAAIVLWKRIVERYSLSPEAAEADLDWGRALRRRGDRAGATERFEHLILSYPASALVPQARRELELLRSGIA